MGVFLLLHKEGFGNQDTTQRCLIVDYQDNQSINQSIKTQACPILNRDSDKLDSQGKYNFPEVCLPQRSVYQKQMPKVSLGTSSGKNWLTVLRNL